MGVISVHCLQFFIFFVSQKSDQNQGFVPQNTTTTFKVSSDLYLLNPMITFQSSSPLTYHQDASSQ